MKVLFLDFDGVLNSAQYFQMRHRKNRQPPYEEDFCPISCSNLLWILEEVPDLKIVISSSWRLGTSMEELRKILAREGVPPECVIDKTPDLYKDKHELPRGLEIQKWLDDNQHLGIEKFCIVDDDSDMEHLTETHFVKTNACVGMDWFVARDIIMRLADPETVAEWQKVVHAI
jgi:hypothetical protein